MTKQTITKRRHRLSKKTWWLATERGQPIIGAHGAPILCCCKTDAEWRPGEKAIKVRLVEVPRQKRKAVKQ